MRKCAILGKNSKDFRLTMLTVPQTETRSLGFLQGLESQKL
jgi:hypothetical protein